MKKTINQMNGLIEFVFEGDLPKITVIAADLNSTVREHAMLHGLSQKIGDAAAISKDETNNYTVTEAMRRDACLAMIEQLRGGDWNAKGRAAPKQDKSILAIAAKRGCTYDEALVWFNERMMSELA